MPHRPTTKKRRKSKAAAAKLSLKPDLQNSKPAAKTRTLQRYHAWRLRKQTPRRPAVEAQAQLQPLRRRSLARYDEESCGQRQQRYVHARLSAGPSVL